MHLDFFKCLYFVKMEVKECSLHTDCGGQDLVGGLSLSGLCYLSYSLVFV